jgi:Flp pilus assembly protein TadG
MLPLVALSAAVLIALIGLSIDLGFAYVTKARLSKACDAAALAGMQNINLGTTTAQAVARAEFYANYANGGTRTSLEAGTVTPTLSFTFSPATSAATQLTVSASTTIRTFFLKVLPALGDAPWGGIAAGNSSVVSRGNLDFTLVLDRSGSMRDNGGKAAMYPAVTNFLGFFSGTLDQAALVTFNTLATNNVLMRNNFASVINSNVNALYNIGYYPAHNATDPNTFTDGERGLYNALNIELPIPMPSTSNLIKAVIFFTDGHMNTLQDNLNCPGPTNLVFTAGDPGPNGQPGQTNIFFFYTYPVAGSATNIGCKVCNGKDPCSASKSFPSLTGGGGMLSFTDNGAFNVRQEAEARCQAWADQMRANQIVV